MENKITESISLLLKKLSFNRQIFLGIVLSLIFVAGAISWIRSTTQQEHPTYALPVLYPVPDFSLIERSGNSIKLPDLIGKVWITNFFFTRCRDTCPLQSFRLSQLQQAFAEEPNVRLVSITVDPEWDTPEILTQYANKFHADSKRWLFLTGDKEVIYELALQGFRLAIRDTREREHDHSTHRNPNGSLSSGGILLHSSRFVLVDRKGNIRGYYQSKERRDIEMLRRHVRVLLKDEG